MSVLADRSSVPLLHGAGKVKAVSVSPLRNWSSAGVEGWLNREGRATSFYRFMLQTRQEQLMSVHSCLLSLLAQSYRDDLELLFVYFQVFVFALRVRTEMICPTGSGAFYISPLFAIKR